MLKKIQPFGRPTTLTLKKGAVSSSKEREHLSTSFDIVQHSKQPAMNALTYCLYLINTTNYGCQFSEWQVFNSGI